MLPPAIQELISQCIAQQRAGDLEGAKALLSRAIEECPRDAEAQFRLSQTLMEFGKLAEALAACRQVVAQRPDFAEAHNRIGIILQKQGFPLDALAAFRKAVEISPGFAIAHSNVLLAMHYPDGIGADAIHQEHLDWAKQHATAPRFSHAQHDRNAERPLRIGYVSGDFFQHPVSYFLEPILAAHDRTQFDVYCYSDTLYPDATHERLRAYPARWHDVLGKSDAEAADIVLADGIDILIDLAGHTSRSRISMFARRPAPVQVSYLGYPNTTGLAEIDYRLTDAIADPVAVTDRLHTERLLRLPRCAWCYRPPPVTPEVSSEQLQAGAITFGSFNNIGKLTPAWLATWCEILRQMPGSRLLLKRSDFRDESTRNRFAEQIASAGIDPDRLVLLGADREHLMHLAAYGLVDVALDTFPYNGTTTTCEAMFMGVPVVTRVGDVHVSRVGASLLGAVGLRGLVSESPEHFVQIAVRLAQDANARSTLRRTLRDRMIRSPLMDERGFVRDYEATLRRMWQAWCTGRKI